MRAEVGVLNDLQCRIPVIGVGARGASVVTYLPTSGLLKTMIVSDELTDLSSSQAELVIKSTVAQLALPGIEEDPTSFEHILDTFLLGQRRAVLVGALGNTVTFELVAALARTARERVGRVVGLFSLPFPFEGSEAKKRAAKQVSELPTWFDCFYILPTCHLLESWSMTALVSSAWRLEETMRLVTREIVDLEEVGRWHVCQVDGSSRLDDQPCLLEGAGLVGVQGEGDEEGEGVEPATLVSAMMSSWLGGADLTEAKQLVVASKHGSDRSDPLNEFLPELVQQVGVRVGDNVGDRDRLDDAHPHREPLVLFAVGFEDLSFLAGW